MSATLRLVRTPTDLSATLADAYADQQWWAAATPEAEALVRHCWRDIYSDLNLIGGDEPELLAAYLDGASHPLSALAAAGLSIVAITREAQAAFAGGKPVPIRITTYIVAALPTYFHLAGDPQRLVHCLGTRCHAATNHLAAHQGGSVHLLGSSEAAIERDAEGAARWCRACQLDLEDAE